MVWTGPITFNEFARNTRTTMLEMINSAKKTITLVEFVMTSNPKEIFHALIDAAKNGVKIRIVFNNGVKERKKIVKLWEKRVTFPTVYTYKPRRKGTSLHAKFLIVDSREVLTTSANLTDFGINENVELGIRHEGKMAKNAENIVDLLIEKGYLVEVNDGS
jgi:phosphatidylserine/phosphatidylglycerophosphate/cardiolipin synthase-like enzyme